MSPCICHGPSNIHTPGICVSHLWLDQVITGMTHQEFASYRRVFVIWPNNIHTHGSCVMTPPFVTGPSYIHITGSCVISPCVCDWTKSAAYPLQDVATYPSICWLFVIFLTIDTFISSPSISKLIDDTWTAVKLHKRQCFFFLPFCPQTEPVIQECDFLEAEISSPLRHPSVFVTRNLK